MKEVLLIDGGCNDQIPAIKCLKYKIDDDISLSCVVVADIVGDGIENVVYGSKNGTIKAFNVIIERWIVIRWMALAVQFSLLHQKED